MGVLDSLEQRSEPLTTLVARRLRREARSAVSALLPGRAGAAYLAASSTAKLQIGTGPNPLPGWLNTDRDPEVPGVVYLDARKRFPFRDATFDYVFSEHQIEHISYAAGQFMLAECYRVLKPGGTIRIATPDLAVLACLCTSSPTPEQERYVRWVVDTFLSPADGYRPAFVLNNAFRAWGHRFLYDEETLRAALERSGFVDVARFPMGESDDEALASLEAHGKAHGNEEMTLFETMALQGRRR